MAKSKLTKRERKRLKKTIEQLVPPRFVTPVIREAVRAAVWKQWLELFPSLAEYTPSAEYVHRTEKPKDV